MGKLFVSEATERHSKIYTFRKYTHNTSQAFSLQAYKTLHELRRMTFFWFSALLTSPTAEEQGHSVTHKQLEPRPEPPKTPSSLPFPVCHPFSHVKEVVFHYE